MNHPTSHHHLFKDATYTNIHFIGICGTAMASVAAEIQRAGFVVTGSDTGVYPPMSTFLTQHNIEVIKGFSPDNLPPSGLIVVGNAVSRGNPELEAALDRRLNLISLPELISRRYLTGKRPIVVAGTHGKTTTTSMIAHILRKTGKDPGWMVGGIPKDLPAPCWNSDGDYFVIEGDEYDTVWWDKRPKFLHYQPFIGIISSIEFDHADIYDDLAAVEAAFRRFAGLLPQSGRLVVNAEDKLATAVAESVCCNCETVGIKPDSDWRIQDVKTSGNSTRYSFTTPAGRTIPVNMELIGYYNHFNAVCAVAACNAAGIDPVESAKALKSFHGVSRRLELVVQNCGVSLYDDFAHHPTAVKSTLEALKREYPERRLWALFEPRSNTSVRNFFAGEITDALSIADRVIIAPIHRKDRIPMEERLDTTDVARNLSNGGVQASAAQSFEEIVDEVEAGITSGDLIVLMSNGAFGGIGDKIKEIIQELGSR